MTSISFKEVQFFLLDHEGAESLLLVGVEPRLSEILSNALPLVPLKQSYKIPSHNSTMISASIFQSLKKGSCCSTAVEHTPVEQNS